MQKTTTLGIWLDFRRAWLIESKNDKLEVREVLSLVDETKMDGGHRSKTPYGPMDVSAEPQHDRRKQNQIDKYFNSIIDQSNPEDKLVIFGPGEAKTAFEKVVHKRMPFIVNLSTVPASKMTENQMTAFVKEKFHLSYK